MADQVVHLPNGSTRRFPSDATPEEINNALGAESGRADTGVPMAHATAYDTPGLFGSAGRREMGRTATEAGIGLVRSPLDAIKGLFGLARHPIDSVSNTASALAHPVDTIKALGDNPREAGSLLGQLILGKVVPGNFGKIADASGRGVSAFGRGMEATGDALGGAKFTVAGTTLPAAGAMDVLLRHDPWGAAVAATPYALKYGGKGMQAVGGAIEAAPEAMRSLIGTDEASTNASLKDAAAKRGASLRRDYGIRQATSKPYRAGSGASDPYVAAEPRAPVTTPPPGDYTTRGAGIEGGRMTMPSPDEPIYSDVRSQLDDVAGLDDELALTREMIAKGFKPSTARRIVSPAMKSLEESAPTSGRYSELLSRFGGKQSVQEPSGDMPGAWQSFMMTPQEEAARNAKTIAESAARRKR